MATLGDLRRTILPGAISVAPVDPEMDERELGWVRVLRARVPAFDALGRGDLAIVSSSALAVVAPDRPGLEALVDALRRASVAALLLAEATESSQQPDGSVSVAALADVAAAAGIPTLLVSGVDAQGLERTVVGFLVNRDSEIERQAELLERRLEGLALGGADLGSLLAAIGGFLGRAAVLEGRRGDRLAIHAPAESPQAVAAAAQYLARAGGVALRVPLPAAPLDASGRDRVGLTGEPLIRGNLVLLGEGPATELERMASARAAALLALELARDVAVERAREVARRSEALPPDGPPWVVIVARQVGAEDLESVDQREAMRAELRMLASNRRLTLRGDSESLEYRLVAVADATDPQGLVVAGRIADFLRRTVVISRPFIDAAARPLAEAEARTTLEAAEQYGAGPSLVRAERLAAYRLLGNLHNLPDGSRLARGLLEPLLAGRPALVASRLRTLQAALDHPGLAEAAHALGVHRNTVAYRIRRIESIGGWDLSDPELRLALAVAVRVVLRDFVQSEQSTSPSATV